MPKNIILAILYVITFPIFAPIYFIGIVIEEIKSFGKKNLENNNITKKYDENKIKKQSILFFGRQKYITWLFLIGLIAGIIFGFVAALISGQAWHKRFF